MPQPTTSRQNGKLGGRPKGASAMHRSIFQARKAVEQAKISLAERCQQHELEYVEVLEGIVSDVKQPANARISAISLILDRGRGKAVQPELHGGNVTLQVVTGVPHADDPDDMVYGSATPRVPGGRAIEHESNTNCKPYSYVCEDSQANTIPYANDMAEVPTDVALGPAKHDPLRSEAEGARQRRNDDQAKQMKLDLGWVRE